MKILILMCYYNRPNMVKFALNSIKEQSHKDWELVFVDDASDVPGEPIVREILKDDIKKIKFFNTGGKVSNKSIFGKFWNQGMEESDAEIVIMLCDDDALYPNYLQSLSIWFKKNTDKKYCYGHIVPYNPFTTQSLKDIKIIKKCPNLHTSIIPYCKVDASQVAWKKQSDILFDFPKTRNLDSSLFRKLFSKYGRCPYNGLIAQYKGIHEDQLGKRIANKKNMYKVHDIRMENNK